MQLSERQIKIVAKSEFVTFFDWGRLIFRLLLTTSKKKNSKLCPSGKWAFTIQSGLKEFCQNILARGC